MIISRSLRFSRSSQGPSKIILSKKSSEASLSTFISYLVPTLRIPRLYATQLSCESAILARRVATRARLDPTRDVPHLCSSVPPMIIFTERLNLKITIAGAICCLIPATLITSRSDGIFRDNSGRGAGANRSPVLVGFLFVVLIPASDLILNLLSRAAILSNPNKSTTQTKCSAVTTLTEIERLLFMTGMAIQSITWFLPDGTNLNTIGVLDVCLHGCSRILLIGPIMLFLQRCTVHWTGFRTFLMLFTGSLGTMAIICNSVLNFNELDSAILSQLGTAFQYTAIAIYLYVIASSVITYSAEKIFNRTTRRVCFAQLFSLIASTASTEYTNKDDKELYTNYIPGLHILFAIILSAADAYESNYTGDAIGEKHVTAVSISFFAQIIVLVMELRIRNCEVARGLVSDIHLPTTCIRIFENRCFGCVYTRFRRDLSLPSDHTMKYTRKQNPSLLSYVTSIVDYYFLFLHHHCSLR